MTFPEVVCVLGIGRNYRDHAAELGNDAPERPMVFAKAPFRVTGEGDPIVLPACCETEQVDYEGELRLVGARREGCGGRRRFVLCGWLRRGQRHHRTVVAEAWIRGAVCPRQEL